MKIDWTDGVEKQGDNSEKDGSEVDLIILCIATKCDQATTDEYNDSQKGVVSDREICDSNEKKGCGDEKYPNHHLKY